MLEKIKIEIINPTYIIYLMSIKFKSDNFKTPCLISQAQSKPRNKKRRFSNCGMPCILLSNATIEDVLSEAKEGSDLNIDFFNILNSVNFTDTTMLLSESYIRAQSGDKIIAVPVDLQQYKDYQKELQQDSLPKKLQLIFSPSKINL